jgi:hypothetical protein
MRRLIFGFAIAALSAATPIQAGEGEDVATARQISTILRESGKITSNGVGVKYQKGTVWLAGQVGSEEQIYSAIETVSNIEGVDRIVNDLTIRGGQQQRTAAKPMQRGRRGGNQNVQLVGAQQAMPRPMATAAGYSGPDMGAEGYPAQPQAPSAPPPMMAQAQGMPPQMMAQNPNGGRPMPAYVPAAGATPPPAAYDQPTMPNYAWPSYAAYPNYAAVTYPKQYSATAWPFIGPFYPYPQVPMGWRKVSLEWDDGWWFLDFDDRACY